MSTRISHVSDDSFEQEVRHASQSQPVLVDFWAEWCGPCRMIAPVLEQLAAEHQTQLKIVKLNVDDNPLTPAALGIRGIPTLILFKDGVPAATQVGAVAKTQLAALLAPHLPASATA